MLEHRQHYHFFPHKMLNVCLLPNAPVLINRVSMSNLFIVISLSNEQSSANNMEEAHEFSELATVTTVSKTPKPAFPLSLGDKITRFSTSSIFNYNNAFWVSEFPCPLAISIFG